MKFGERLKEMRQARGMTQRALAEVLKMDVAYLSRTENGVTNFLPSRKTVELIARSLGLSADESDELHALAGKIPADVEAALLGDLKLMKLVRRKVKQ